ncbi:hypothetical protein TH61_07805 [Rufibacter sp. DG15C]|nr:hypothetical protein TH61_07805 [Rufibacter sp. DG15C]
MTNPKDYKELLALFKAGLAAGVIDKVEVTKWADGFILTKNEPDYFFIELSLAKSKNDAITLIGEELDSAMLANGKAILGLLHKRFTQGDELEAIVKTMYHLLNNVELSESEVWEIYTIAEYFDMAHTKVHGSLESVRQRVADFLALYKDYSIDNYPEWLELDKKADSALEEANRKARERFEAEQKSRENKKSWWKNLWQNNRN